MSTGPSRQPHGRIVPQSVGIVMVAPALRGQQDRGAQEGRQVMHHVSLSPGIVEPVPHPGYDAADLKDFSQEHAQEFPVSRSGLLSTSSYLLNPGMTGCNFSPMHASDAAAGLCVAA